MRKKKSNTGSIPGWILMSQNIFLQPLSGLVIKFQLDYRSNTLKNKLGRKP